MGRVFQSFSLFTTGAPARLSFALIAFIMEAALPGEGAGGEFFCSDA